MSDAVLLYFFIFLMVSNLLISLSYAVGARHLREVAKKAFRPDR